MPLLEMRARVEVRAEEPREGLSPVGLVGRNRETRVVVLLEAFCTIGV